MMMSCLLHVEAHALWVQRSKLLYPVALPSFSRAFNASHDFKDCDHEIVQGVACAVEMACYWFLCPPMSDVIVMSVEADVEGVHCLSNILLTALPAFDDVPCLAGSCSTYVEGLVGGCALNIGACLDVAAGEAASGATRTASTDWLDSGCLELCFDQTVLWSAVGYQRPFGDGFFQAVGGM